jgi:hypothetical protein
MYVVFVDVNQTVEQEQLVERNDQESLQEARYVLLNNVLKMQIGLSDELVFLLLNFTCNQVLETARS